MAKKLRIEDIEQKITIVPLSRDEINHCIRCRVLVVCEGSKTEPNYFNSFSMMKNSSSFVFEVFPEGGGISTLAVVDKAIELRDKAVKHGHPYDSVWAVFDKDGSLILTSIMQYRRQNRAALDVLGAMRLSNCGTYIILTAVVPQ